MAYLLPHMLSSSPLELLHSPSSTTDEQSTRQAKADSLIGMDWLPYILMPYVSDETLFPFRDAYRRILPGKRNPHFQRCFDKEVPSRLEIVLQLQRLCGLHLTEELKQVALKVSGAIFDWQSDAEHSSRWFREQRLRFARTVVRFMATPEHPLGRDLRQSLLHSGIPLATLLKTERDPVWQYSIVLSSGVSRNKRLVVGESILYNKAWVSYLMSHERGLSPAQASDERLPMQLSVNANDR